MQLRHLGQEREKKLTSQHQSEIKSKALALILDAKKKKADDITDKLYTDRSGDASLCLDNMNRELKDAQMEGISHTNKPSQ